MIFSGIESILNDDDDDDIIFGDDDDEIDDNLENDIIDDFQTKPGEVGLSHSKNPQWFNGVEIVQQFYQFLVSLKSNNSPAISILLQQIGPDTFMSNMRLLSAYPNHKKLIESYEK